MKEIIMANGNLKASEIGLGCMRIANLEKNTVNKIQLRLIKKEVTKVTSFLVRHHGFEPGTP